MLVSLPEYRIVTRADSVELVRHHVSREEVMYKLNVFYRDWPQWTLTDAFSEEQVDQAFDMIARTIAKAQQINGIAEFNVKEMRKALEGAKE